MASILDTPLARRAVPDLRSLAGITAAGALAGVLVGGVGGRLAMMLLARLNPQATGVTSDDGFTMGRFTLGNTLSLLVVTLGLGLLGAAFYAVLRGLMIGPHWFRVASISVGPAVVVGQLLVHTDGVDFRLLDPAGLAISMFVLIPGLYALLLTLLAERWTSPNGWSSRASLTRVLPALVLWVVVFPLLAALAVVVVLWFFREALRGSGALTHPALPWLARAALSLVFLASAVLLISTTAELT